MTHSETCALKYVIQHPHSEVNSFSFSVCWVQPWKPEQTYGPSKLHQGAKADDLMSTIEVKVLWTQEFYSSVFFNTDLSYKSLQMTPLSALSLYWQIWNSFLTFLCLSRLHEIWLYLLNQNTLMILHPKPLAHIPLTDWAMLDKIWQEFLRKYIWSWLQ